jgi:hypothetical protein
MDISFSSILTWFKTVFQDIIGFFRDIVLWFWDKLISKAVDLAISIIDSLTSCCSETVSTFTAGWSYIATSNLGYFMDTLNIDLALKLMAAAYLARFTLRRMPIFG